MLPWIQTVVTAIVSVLASSGFWAYWQRRHEDNSARTKLLVGLAHDRIMQSGTFYMNRGWISNGEYEDLVDYLYKPYSELGGNGSAQRIVDHLAGLPHQPPVKKGEDEDASAGQTV